MSARGFLWRWNLRVLRNEWRQHFVIFSLIAIGMALSVGGLLAAFNLVEPPESEFGNAQLIATTDSPEQLEAALASAGFDFARVDSATVQIDGSAQRLQARSFDHGANPVAPLIALMAGDWPEATNEIALTDRAIVDGGTVGSTIRLGNKQLRVVGIVENPTRLSDEFAFVADLANIDVGSQEPATEFYVDAEPDQMRFSDVPNLGVATSEGPPVRTAVTLVVSVVSALGMLEVALLVGAGFAVIARRRSRQFGLLAASGATPAQVRTAATAAGILIGLFGTIVGLIIGGSIGRLLLPQLETTVGHRISFGVPWAAIVFNALLAIAIAGLASRWPSRPMSKAPVVELLTSLRPKVAPVGKPAFVGVVLTVAGAAALGIGFAQLNTLLAVLGVLLAPIGLLLMAPLLVKLLGPLSSKLPLAPRMGGRAVARHNRRSASVVAALALALSIPIGVAVVTKSIDERNVALGPNVADNWLIGWQPGADDSTERIPVDLDPDLISNTIARVASETDDLTLFPLQTAVPRNAFTESWDFDSAGVRRSVAPMMAGRPAAPDCFTCNSYGFGEVDADGNSISYLVSETWIASPELLSALGIDQDLLAGGSSGLSKSSEYSIVSDNGVVATSDTLTVAPVWPNNARVPPALVAPDAVSTEAYNIVDVGFFAWSTEPITSETRTLLRKIAGPDLVMEFHVSPEPRSGLRAIGLFAGIVVGIGIALSAVSLFTSELASDLAVLSSIGASPRTARLLVASVAAMLAAAGTLIALVIGYLPLLPLLTAKEVDFPFVVPWATLAGFIVLFPVLVAMGGWLASRKASHVQISS